MFPGVITTVSVIFFTAVGVVLFLVINHQRNHWTNKCVIV